jgi:hypothetical protein
MLLYQFLDLSLHGVKIEGRWRLHGRIIDSGLRQRRDLLLDLDKAPELAGVEVVQVAATLIVERLAAA